MTETDELLERIRNGAADDFGEIVRRHSAYVFAILHRYESDAQRLEDLAQETFVKAWRSLGSYDGRVPFQHWLGRIAANVAIDHLRKRKRTRNEVGFPDLGPDALDWLRAENDEAPLRASGARELLEAAMRDLTPAERLAITLLEIEGRSVKETSALTGSSGVAVRVRALRARAKLRRAIRRLEQETDEGTKTG